MSMLMILHICQSVITIFRYEIRKKQKQMTADVQLYNKSSTIKHLYKVQITI